MKNLFDLIDIFPEGVAMIDNCFNIVKCNDAFSVCYAKVTEGNRSLKELFPTVFTENTSQEKSVSVPETFHMKASAPITIDGIPYAVITVRDITEEVKAEEIRNELMGNVSHEIRTPLSIIKGSAELLAEDALETEEEKHSFYEKILSEASALEKLAGDLLDRARLKAGKIEINTSPLDIDGMLEDLVEKMKLIAEKKSLQLEFIPSGAPEAEVDYDRFRQVAIIFIDNAIKFTDEGGKITVKTAFDRDSVKIDFSDNGRGIPEEDIPYVFQRFYKVAREKRNTMGSGLGLSIAWQIVQLHKGTISINSKIGEGTTFTVTIPLPKD